jgi:Na+/H+-dicarboxylate symporter
MPVVLALVCVVLLSPVALFAQGSTGTITGIVTDSSEAVLPGAAIEAVNTATGVLSAA